MRMSQLSKIVVIAGMVTCLAAMLAMGLVVTAFAQTAPQVDPYAPIRCYDRVDRVENLEHLKAMELCTGAVSEAPADCYSDAEALLQFVDDDIVRMCRMATSRAPAECAAHLDETTPLVEQEIVDYCAALQWPLVAPPTGGTPECVEAALDRTTLTENRALQLCRGSSTPDPVDCFITGDNQLNLTEDDLVQLCSLVVAYPYVQPWQY
jgi:hypothetical protein